MLLLHVIGKCVIFIITLVIHMKHDLILLIPSKCYYDFVLKLDFNLIY